MGWHYQARKCNKNGETWYELVESFPDVGEGCHTEDAVSVMADTKADLAKWLRIAANDVEKYPAINEED